MSETGKKTLHLLKCGCSQIRTYMIFQTQSSKGLRGSQPRNAWSWADTCSSRGPGRSLDSPRDLLSPQMLTRTGCENGFPCKRHSTVVAVPKHIRPRGSGGQEPGSGPSLAGEQLRPRRAGLTGLSAGHPFCQSTSLLFAHHISWNYSTYLCYPLALYERRGGLFKILMSGAFPPLLRTLLYRAKLSFILDAREKKSGDVRLYIVHCIQFYKI